MGGIPMFNKNRILFKFNDVFMPDIITSNDRIRISSISIEKNEDKIAEIDVMVNQEKGVQKD
jgi:hypothetical protein